MQWVKDLICWFRGHRWKNFNFSVWISCRCCKKMIYFTEAEEHQNAPGITRLGCRLFGHELDVIHSGQRTFYKCKNCKKIERIT